MKKYWMHAKCSDNDRNITVTCCEVSKAAVNCHSRSRSVWQSLSVSHQPAKLDPSRYSVAVARKPPTRSCKSGQQQRLPHLQLGAAQRTSMHGGMGWDAEKTAENACYLGVNKIHWLCSLATIQWFSGCVHSKVLTLRSLLYCPRSFCTRQLCTTQLCIKTSPKLTESLV
jgi:hypothetical protein